jgi:23S rRNA maturation-related 3'-5' exoribonuclease YhaM
MHTSTLKLIDQAKALGSEVYQVAAYILEDKRFDVWSGSSNSQQHHYGTNGLTIHTHEIMTLAFDAVDVLKLNINKEELYFSVLFHDSGKMYDYETVDNINFTSAPHKRLIHHISRSGLIWHDASSLVPRIYDTHHDNVLHNILAHHGKREHGSPVMPLTKTAWLVHLCDSISARMNDCDRLDFVHIP